MKTSLSQIQKSLNELASTLEKCAENKEFTAIEHDILLAKTRQVYEGILSMEVAQAAPVVEAPQPAKEVVAETVIEVISEPITQPEPIIEAAPVAQPEPVKEPDPIVEAKPEPVVEPAKPVQEEITFVVEEVEAPSIPVEQPTAQAEQPKQETPKFAQVTDLGSKLAQKPIKDIFSALSINERYMFRSQLFNNDQDLFMKSINTLNESKDFKTALEFIKTHFSWDFESKDVQRFLSIVERRFLQQWGN